MDEQAERACMCTVACPQISDRCLSRIHSCAQAMLAKDPGEMRTSGASVSPSSALPPSPVEYCVLNSVVAVPTLRIVDRLSPKVTLDPKLRWWRGMSKLLGTSVVPEACRKPRKQR